jgi:hypothetical protein
VAALQRVIAVVVTVVAVRAAVVVVGADWRGGFVGRAVMQVKGGSWWGFGASS